VFIIYKGKYFFQLYNSPSKTLIFIIYLGVPLLSSQRRIRVVLFVASVLRTLVISRADSDHWRAWAGLYDVVSW